MLVTRTFQAGPEAPAQARELIRDLPVSADSRAKLALIVSELVANSVVHGANADRGVTVTLESNDLVVRGEVHDGGAGFDWEPHLPDWTEPGGLGLVLVDWLTENWGVRRDSVACVWFVCAAS